MYPEFPTYFPSGLTEDRLERIIQRIVDKADALFMAGHGTQEQYNAYMRDLNEWSDRMYVKNVLPFQSLGKTLLGS
jgi:hypothetical protein